MWRIMGRKVLVVDDAAFMRMMLKDILVKNDFEVAGEAENGNVAVAAYQKVKPDIVTMDITMPEMNGIEAVKAIKAIDPESKIIMVSAMGQQPMVIEAIQAGATDFIVKPFQPDRVVEALNKALGERGSPRDPPSFPQRRSSPSLFPPQLPQGRCPRLQDICSESV